VSHEIAFGYGLTTWEWWSENALRGPLHPYFFALVYKFLYFINLDNTFLFTFLPFNIIQPFFAAMWDYFLIKLALELNLTKQLPFIIIINFSCHLGLSYANRLYSNVIEGVLISVSLFYWIRTPNIKIKE